MWKSPLACSIKVCIFLPTVESVLLYGCGAWTITKTLKKRINGCYTRMLRMCLGISWKQKLTNDELYRELPRVTVKIAERRTKLAGHWIRHSELSASNLVLWTPQRGTPKQGKPAMTYIDCLCDDLGVEDEREIRTAMNDMSQWRELSGLVRADARTK